MPTFDTGVEIALRVEGKELAPRERHYNGMRDRSLKTTSVKSAARKRVIPSAEDSLFRCTAWAAKRDIYKLHLGSEVFKRDVWRDHVKAQGNACRDEPQSEAR